MNPVSQGGTGQFFIKTMMGQNIVDENLIFGVIGIASAVQKLSNTMVSFQSGGLNYAGAYTTFLIRFKLPLTIPSSSYFLLTIPSGFSLNAHPPCSSYPLYNYRLPGNLLCSLFTQSASSSTVLIYGLINEVKGGTDCGILLWMRNPGYSGTVGNFGVGVYRGGTNMVYAWKNDIDGVTVATGPIQEIQLQKIDEKIIAAKNKIMDYELRFQLNNELGEGKKRKEGDWLIYSL
jgi:hypothetical protein